MRFELSITKKNAFVCQRKGIIKGEREGGGTRVNHARTERDDFAGLVERDVGYSVIDGDSILSPQNN